MFQCSPKQHIKTTTYYDSSKNDCSDQGDTEYQQQKLGTTAMVAAEDSSNNDVIQHQ